MSFNGFLEDDFATFTVEGLEPRMRVIQERLQPKFRLIGEELVADLSLRLGSELFLHIAKHLRRTVNPPYNTWLAISANKRGYKQHPHFEVGLFDDRVFIWLAFIDELPRKQEIARTFLQHIKWIQDTVPDHFHVSLDHTKKDALPMKEAHLENVLKRMRDVKKSELLIGRQITAKDAVSYRGDAFMSMTKDTLAALIPLYQLAYQ